MPEIVATLEDLIVEIPETMRLLLQEVAGAKEESVNVETAITELHDQADEIFSSLDTAFRDFITEMSTRRTSLSEDTFNLENAIELLRNELSATQGDLIGQLQESQENLISLATQLGDAQTPIEDSSNAAIEQLEGAQADIQAAQQQLTEIVNEVSQEVDTLQTEIDTAKAKVEGAITQLTDEFSESEQELDIKVDEIINVFGNLEELESELSSIRETTIQSELDSMLASVEESIGGLQTDIENSINAVTDNVNSRLEDASGDISSENENFRSSADEFKQLADSL